MARDTPARDDALQPGPRGQSQAGDRSSLIEVWGDTVDTRHLVWAIVLGVGLGAPAYLLAEWGFGMLDVEPALTKSYALLAGIAACIVAAVISARLFRPKRVVVVGETDATTSRQAAMDSIEDEIGPLGDPDELPARLQDEVRALGLYDDLAAQHRRRLDREGNA